MARYFQNLHIRGKEETLFGAFKITGRGNTNERTPQAVTVIAFHIKVSQQG
jgi:hypothetical protein